MKYIINDAIKWRDVVYIQKLIHCINTLRTGDADLRFYVTTVQDG